MYTIIQITDPKKVYTPATFAVNNVTNEIMTKSPALLSGFHYRPDMTISRLKKHIKNMIVDGLTVQITTEKDLKD